MTSDGDFDYVQTFRYGEFYVVRVANFHRDHSTSSSSAGSRCCLPHSLALFPFHWLALQCRHPLHLNHIHMDWSGWHGSSGGRWNVQVVESPVALYYIGCIQLEADQVQEEGKQERIQFPVEVHIWRWMKSDRKWISLRFIECRRKIRSAKTDRTWLQLVALTECSWRHRGEEAGDGMWMLHWVSAVKEN